MDRTGVQRLSSAYEDRLRNERDTFAAQANLHDDLPPAFHHWSARHVLPKLNALGVASLEEFFVEPIAATAAERGRPITVLSIGSGNGEQELGWLAAARERGAHDIRLRLLEFNPVMQQRAAERAAGLGLSADVDLLVADFNTWRADARYDVVIANQALHHVVALEHLYAQIAACLDPDGVLVVSDMIGRNGHRRWPEALEVVERLWAGLPRRLRRNRITGEVDDTYPDQDYSTVGFEGVRAQDVLPLLLESFHPEVFFAFGNVADPFMDRIYGGNFDLDVPEDRRFVEHLGELDDALIDTGVLTPTHLIATFRSRPVPARYHGGRSPRRCVRDTTVFDPGGRVSFSPASLRTGGVLTGHAIAVGHFNGLTADCWVGQELEAPVFAPRPVTMIRVMTYVPEHYPVGTLRLLVDGVEQGERPVHHGSTACTFPVDLPAGRTVVLRLLSDWFVVPHEVGWGPDVRQLSFRLTGLELGSAALLAEELAERRAQRWVSAADGPPPRG